LDPQCSRQRGRSRSASEDSIRDAVRNAIKVAEEHGFQSIVFPLIGAGSGGLDQGKAKQIMLNELQKLESLLEVTVVIDATSSSL